MSYYILSKMAMVPTINSKLESHKSYGLDGVLAIVLRICAHEQAPIPSKPLAFHLLEILFCL